MFLTRSNDASLLGGLNSLRRSVANYQMMIARRFSLDYRSLKLDYRSLKLDYRSLKLYYRSLKLDYPLEKTMYPLLSTSPSHEPYRYYKPIFTLPLARKDDQRR